METKRTSLGALRVLQFMDVLLLLACTGMGALILYAFADSYLSIHPVPACIPALASAACFAGVLPCTWVAQAAFFRLCGQLRTGAAFTAQNDQSLGRISIACAAGTILLLGTCLLSAFSSFYAAEQILDSATMFVLAFLMGAVALIARILQLLMRRAAAIQQENDGIV